MVPIFVPRRYAAKILGPIIKALELPPGEMLQAEFSIDETGRAVDGFVRTAIPSEVFDEESLSALENWRYEPAMQDGVPVRRDGVIVSFTFMLR